MAKKKVRLTDYVALVLLSDDVTKTVVQPGEPVPAGIFDGDLENWLEIEAIDWAEGKRPEGES